MSNMSEIQKAAPAGWYDDGSGQMRYWDGTTWGPVAPPPPAPAVQPKFSGISIAAFVLACVGLLAFATGPVGFILDVLAVIFSIAGLADRTRRGRGFAAAGIIIATAGLTLSFMLLVNSWPT